LPNCRLPRRCVRLDRTETPGVPSRRVDAHEARSCPVTSRFAARPVVPAPARARPRWRPARATPGSPVLTLMLFPVGKVSYEREDAEKDNDPRNKKGDLPIVEDGIHKQVASPARRTPHSSKVLDRGTASRWIVIAFSPRDAASRRLRVTEIEPKVGRWLPGMRPRNMLCSARGLRP
jgi:hypothetical protein